jgi:methyl-accepting chemotaxis protein
MFALLKTYQQEPDDAEAKLEALDKSQAVIEFTLDGTILNANENFLKTLGYTLDEIKGQHHSLLVDSEYARSPEYKQFWSSLRQGNYQSAEYKRLAKGGREVWIQASYNPIFDQAGKPYMVVKYATDITEQKLRNADYEGQLKAISKAQAVIQFTLDGTILDANENFLKTLGYNFEEIKGQHHSLFVEPEYARGTEYKQFWSSLRQGIYQSAEYKRIGKGGREIWIQASYNPIFDPSGKPFKVVKYATDITQQVRQRTESDRAGGLVDSNLGKITDTIESISNQTSSVAEAATQTSANLQTVASGAEEMTASIQDIAASVTISRNAVEKAMAETESAGERAALLSHAAESMSGVTEFIQHIANNINLLALNATIESARAEEAGKGFAVVATEVKSLARQVAEATERISKEISGVQDVSSKVVEALGSIKSSMGEVEGSVAGVAGAIEEQSAVTREISTNMQMMAGAMRSVEESIQGILIGVKDAKTISAESRELYAELRKLAA